MSEKVNWYKCCFVPNCKNTTVATPQKVFITVPINSNIRMDWCNAVGQLTKLNRNSYCCEDHFDLKNDLKDYKYAMEKGRKKVLKKGVLPRILAQKKNVEQLETSLEQVLELHEKPEETRNKSHYIKRIKLELADKGNILDAMSIENSTQTDNIGMRDKGLQVRVKYRSVGISCNINPNFQVKRNAACSPCFSDTPLSNINIIDRLRNASSNKLKTNSESDNSLNATESASAKDSSANSLKTVFTKQNMRKHVLFMMEDDPLLFMGIAKQSLFVIEEMRVALNLSMTKIYMILNKIRLKRTNAELAYYFGISESQISQIFNKNISRMSCLLETIITWPGKKMIYKNLPVAFRSRYNKVQSIIDCFEIQIEKPNDPVNEFLTWSESRQYNTAKYLISITPDGLINFLSKGYGGRATDLTIVEESGYLSVIPAGAHVLVYRGFKHLEPFLQAKKCELHRLSSESINAKSGNTNVDVTEKIASFRSQVEKVICRIREWQMLETHATIDHYTLQYLDDIVLIAAALVNLQSPIMDQV